MKGRIKLTNGIGELEQAIRSHVKNRANRTFKQVESLVKQKLETKIRSNILSSNTTRSLLNGKLRSDFGLNPTDAGIAVAAIVDHIVNNLEVNLKYSFRGKNIATFTLDLLPMGIEELSVLPQGNYLSTGKFGGGDVSWLTWLLTKGTTVVIGDYYVLENPRGASRSGSSVMQKNGKGGSGFRVDPAFAGTAQDNFVIRALEPIIPEIIDEIFKVFKEVV